MKQRPVISCLLGVMVCFVLLIGLSGCKESEEVLADPTGVLIQSTGCKQTLDTGGFDGVSGEGVDDCIEYSYDGKSTLILKHVNAGFNCCPGEITAEITFNGDQVIIKEEETEQACDCLCLFDLDFEVINLEPGNYSIRVIEPYADVNDPVLEFNLELLSAATGKFCLKRTHYPWIQ
jgi:hypothetical protein